MNNGIYMGTTYFHKETDPMEIYFEFTDDGLIEGIKYFDTNNNDQKFIGSYKKTKPYNVQFTIGTFQQYNGFMIRKENTMIGDITIVSENDHPIKKGFFELKWNQERNYNENTMRTKTMLPQTEENESLRLNLLIQMGFCKELSVEACKATKNIQDAIEWIETFYHHRMNIDTDLSNKKESKRYRISMQSAHCSEDKMLLTL